MINSVFGISFIGQVVQEYERAVVFRLGRLRSGGAKGPGLFFVMPCVDSYKKVDLRTVSFDVPPQEVHTMQAAEVFDYCVFAPAGPLARLGDSQRGRRRLLSSVQPHHGHQQHRGL